MRKEKELCMHIRVELYFTWITGYRYKYCNNFFLNSFDTFNCNKIYYGAYSNKWYIMNPKIIQNLLLLMMRGFKAVYFTAGKIFSLTMVTFYSVRYRNV